MENKQTAVQWLIENMPEDYRLALPYELVEQAIQMEREQIEEAFRYGQALHAMGCETRAPQYYKKAFKP